ncbi:MAG: 2-oxoglutarate and iron-dependent oxygenase domain-containing protein [Pseudomonadota bacterium]
MSAIPRKASVDEVPILDLGSLAEGADIRPLARALRATCEETAFFYIRNHGIPESVLDDVFAQARRFFERPVEARMTVLKDRFHRGYLPIGTTRYPGRQPDLKDSFDIGIDLPLDDPDVMAGTPLYGPNQWPADLPGFRAPVERYFDAVRALGMRLLRVFAISLDLEADFFQKLYRKPSVLTRLMHYPMPEATMSADMLGASQHTDFGVITILAQDPSGGLEVLKRDGEWIGAPYVEGTFVVNLGDLMHRWTNDIYQSNPHRVVNRIGRSRYSIPTFFNPDHRAKVEVLPTCLRPGEAPKYEPVLAGEYVSNKIKVNQGYRPPNETAA